MNVQDQLGSTVEVSTFNKQRFGARVSLFIEVIEVTLTSAVGGKEVLTQ